MRTNRDSPIPPKDRLGGRMAWDRSSPCEAWERHINHMEAVGADYKFLQHISFEVEALNSDFCSFRFVLTVIQ